VNELERGIDDEATKILTIARKLSHELQHSKIHMASLLYSRSFDSKSTSTNNSSQCNSSGGSNSLVMMMSSEQIWLPSSMRKMMYQCIDEVFEVGTVSFPATTVATGLLSMRSSPQSTPSFPHPLPSTSSSSSSSTSLSDAIATCLDRMDEVPWLYRNCDAFMSSYQSCILNDLSTITGHQRKL
jgi:hypothetical protein